MLNVKLLLLMLLVVMELLQIMQQPLLLLGITQLGMMLVLIPTQRKDAEVEDWEVEGITGEAAEETSEVELKLTKSNLMERF